MTEKILNSLYINEVNRYFGTVYLLNIGTLYLFFYMNKVHCTYETYA